MLLQWPSVVCSDRLWAQPQGSSRFISGARYLGERQMRIYQPMRVAPTVVRSRRRDRENVMRTIVGGRSPGGKSRLQPGQTSCAAHTDTCPNEFFLIATSTPDKCQCHPSVWLVIGKFSSAARLNPPLNFFERT